MCSDGSSSIPIHHKLLLDLEIANHMRLPTLPPPIRDTFATSPFVTDADVSILLCQSILLVMERALSHLDLTKITPCCM